MSVNIEELKQKLAQLEQERKDADERIIALNKTIASTKLVSQGRTETFMLFMAASNRDELAKAVGNHWEEAKQFDFEIVLIRFIRGRLFLVALDILDYLHRLKLLRPSNTFITSANGHIEKSTSMWELICGLSKPKGVRSCLNVLACLLLMYHVNFYNDHADEIPSSLYHCSLLLKASVNSDSRRYFEYARDLYSRATALKDRKNISDKCKTFMSYILHNIEQTIDSVDLFNYVNEMAPPDTWNTKSIHFNNVMHKLIEANSFEIAVNFYKAHGDPVRYAFPIGNCPKDRELYFKWRGLLPESVFQFASLPSFTGLDIEIFRDLFARYCKENSPFEAAGKERLLDDATSDGRNDMAIIMIESFGAIVNN